ncbi:MAG: cytochrome c oxidase assembly protein [Firmicutes bacterium]|nr:cytochrome c oxidase assembly protein [Bacillota bacterium]
MYLHEFWQLFIDLVHWQLDVIVQAIVIEVLYLFMVSRLQRGAHAENAVTTRLRTTLFTLGVIVFLLAFGSPINFISDDLLFSMHSVQHLLEIMIMTPLWLAGIPKYPFDRVVSWVHLPATLFHPVATLAVFNVVFFFFHIPRVYDLTLQNEYFHLLEHGMFFIISIFLWMPILSPLDQIPRLTLGKRLLYVFFVINLAMPAEIFLILAQHTLYAYSASGAALFGMSVLGDQQLGFLLMIVGMFVPMISVGIYTFSRYDSSVWNM